MLSEDQEFMSRDIAGHVPLVALHQFGLPISKCAFAFPDRGKLPSSGDWIHIHSDLQGAHVPIPADKYRLATGTFEELRGRVHLFTQKPKIPDLPAPRSLERGARGAMQLATGRYGEPRFCEGNWPRGASGRSGRSGR